MLKKSKHEWDFGQFVTPQLKTIDLYKTPRSDHMHQMMRLANSISLKEDQSPNEAGQSNLRIPNTFPSSLMSPIDNMGLEDKRLRFDGDLFPHRSPNNYELDQFSMNKIDKKLNFQIQSQQEYDQIEEKQHYIQFQQANKNKTESSFNKFSQQKSKPKRKPRPKDKGLRQLSELCFQIVKKQKRTNYKSVAQQLIQSMKQDGLLNAFDQKQESNIRRRVYDALNVLIALDILIKQGKDIYFTQQNNCQKTQKELTQQIQKIKSLTLQKKEKIKRLRQKMNQAKKKYECCKMLIKRNKSNKNIDCCQIIRLPFVGITFSTIQQGGIQLSQNNRVFINCHEDYQSFGDLDTLTNIDFSRGCNSNKKQPLFTQSGFKKYL